ncbi:MAG TPA: hypothetical protein H9875_00405 [Candidatus Levilactobacillus faecigallinarum]|uniref:Uncharacterized protein n=1 Tax=Candidatus Levilactobacillus faecigallinarum TaxID=2838638 RepID=A0A9D1QQT3_9LACO|nr:hypothetical protein [Candidatus Levilactobacillus faecigallinarum]
MPQVQSIYFAKNAGVNSNDNGSTTTINELRFSVYEKESFVIVVSLIDLNPSKEYDVQILFFDNETDKSIFRIDGHLRISPNKPDQLKSGFILMEPIQDLPSIVGDRYKVSVSIREEGKKSVESFTDLLLMKGENPLGK